jgi:hypothetical protein
MVIYRISHKINSSKSHPYVYLSPPIPLRIVGLLLLKFSKFNLADSYHFQKIGRQKIYAPKKPNKKFSLESVQEYNWSEKLNQTINFTIRLNGEIFYNLKEETIMIKRWRFIIIPKDRTRVRDIDRQHQKRYRCQGLS